MFMETMNTAKNISARKEKIIPKTMELKTNK